MGSANNEIQYKIVIERIAPKKITFTTEFSLLKRTYNKTNVSQADQINKEF
jgi:hypothetical protein